MKTLYLVLDMENDLVNADGPNGKSPLGAQVKSRDLVARTAKAIAKARAAGAVVGFVRVGFLPGYVGVPSGSQVFSGAPKAGLFKLGAWGTEIHPDLEEKEGDVQVIKNRVSPFYSTTLEAQLRGLGIERIVCSGVSTQAVVQATVRDGHDRDYAMVVLEDCCAAHSAEEHANSMASIARFCTSASSDTFEF
ncbi:cysteine hydrolase [soil metagenome]